MRDVIVDQLQLYIPTSISISLPGVFHLRKGLSLYSKECFHYFPGPHLVLSTPLFPRPSLVYYSAKGVTLAMQCYCDVVFEEKIVRVLVLFLL